MSTADQNRVVTHNGHAYRIYGRAWWLDAAASTPDGRVAVARIHAQSTTLRRPSKAQLAADAGLDPYGSDARHEGELEHCLLQLTEADLVELGLTPGRWTSSGANVVNSPRPRRNVTGQAVSRREPPQSMEGLHNDAGGRPSEP